MTLMEIANDEGGRDQTRADGTLTRALVTRRDDDPRVAGRPQIALPAGVEREANRAPLRRGAGCKRAGGWQLRPAGAARRDQSAHYCFAVSHSWSPCKRRCGRRDQSHGNTAAWAPSAWGTRRRPRSRRLGAGGSGAGAGVAPAAPRAHVAGRAASRRGRRHGARRRSRRGARPRAARRERDQGARGGVWPVAGAPLPRRRPRDNAAPGPRQPEPRRLPAPGAHRETSAARPRRGRASFRRPARGVAPAAPVTCPAAAPRPGEAPLCTSTRGSAAVHHTRPRPCLDRTVSIGLTTRARAARADERRLAPPLAASHRGVVAADGVPARCGERRSHRRPRRAPPPRAGAPRQRRRSGCQCSHGLQHFTACSYACMHQCLYLCICGDGHCAAAATTLAPS